MIPPFDSLVFMDLEARSPVDIRRAGARKYALDPRTRILSGVFLRGREVLLWSPLSSIGLPARDPADYWPHKLAARLDIPLEGLTVRTFEGPELPALLADPEGRFARSHWVAHNAEDIDRPLWERAAGSPVAGWVDTLKLARMLSLPGGIDAIARNLYGLEKDKGSATMLALSKPIAKGRLRGRYLPLNRHNIPELLRYNIADVLLMAAFYRDHVEGPARKFSADLPTIAADSAINARGVLLDRTLAEAIIEVELELRDEVADEVSERLSELVQALDVDYRGETPSEPVPAKGEVRIVETTVSSEKYPEVTRCQSPWHIADEDPGPGERCGQCGGLWWDSMGYVGADGRNKVPGDPAPEPVADPQERLSFPVRTSGEFREALRSQVKFRELLRIVFEVDLPNCQRQTILETLDDDGLSELCRDVLLARIGETRITSSKLSRGLELADDEGVVRSTLNYWGAHTGRFAGRGLQFQNLPRQAKGVELDATVSALLEPDPKIRLPAFRRTVPEGLRAHDVLSAAIRTCIRARPGRRLFIADYSNIEARVLLWLAGDEEGLRVFFEGGDPYKEFSAKLFGVQVAEVTKGMRAVGKVCVLGCGFSMSAHRLKDYAGAMGIDFEAAGITAEQAVEGWRDANPLIAGTRTGSFYNGVAVRSGGFWRAAAAAFELAINGGESEVGRCYFSRWRGNVVVELPSERALIYRDAAVRPLPKFGEVRDCISYRRFRGKSAFIVGTYGGKLVENLTQAAARDYLTEALCRLEECTRTPAVLHIHDEIIAEVPEVDAEDHARAILIAMTDLPEWSPGFPLGAEGFISDRYRKSPPVGSREIKALNGEVSVA